jgi:Lipocalin-like domain
MQGTWWLQSREDWTKDGQRRIDPVLEPDPIGILSYAKNHFAAQFMKRNRTGDPAGQITYSGQNNTSAVGGYDAYFGTYDVNVKTGKVAHTLIGSITPLNMGMTVSRDLRVNDNNLMIQLETTTPVGEPITRTLIWTRIS